MDKISSILPSNARVKTVDLDESHPVRPGTPTFGRRVGANRLGAEKVNFSEQAIRSAKLQEAKAQTLAGRNPREEAHVKIVENMTNAFFNKRVEDMKEAKGAPLSEEIAAVDTAIVPEAPVQEAVPSDETKSLSVYA